MSSRLNITKPISRFPLFVALLWLAIFLAGNCAQAATARPVAPATSISLDIDKAQVIHLPQAALNVFIANPDIADLQVPDHTSFIVFGKKAGRTTAFVTSASGAVTQYAITVTRPAGDIAADLRAQVPNATVEVTSLPNGLLVSGHVGSPAEAAKLKAVARQYLSDKESLTFDVKVDQATQVNLQVRIAEVSKQATKNFGFNWSAILNNGTIAIGLLTGRVPVTSFGNFIPSPAPNNFDSIGLGYRSPGGSVNISSLIDALQNEGLITVLAEPNLTTISGEPANFLAGGEFPIPVSEGNQQISIEFKRFGVSLSFTPTVLDANRLSIKVAPEVSELSSAGAVTINSITVPGLSVRRADTTVELASGQSFAIAGLLQNNASNNVQQIPALGDLPVLGALFRSTQFQRNESELVIIITPYIVKPAARTADLHLPSEGLVYANDIEQILLGRLTASKSESGSAAAGVSPPHLSGPAGFLTE